MVKASQAISAGLAGIATVGVVRLVTARGVVEPIGPTASFTFSPTNPVPDESVTFDASGSSGSILTYEWNFGDGTTAAGEVTTHAYLASGDFDVTLTVIDSDGQTDTTTQTVSVSGTVSGGYGAGQYGAGGYGQDPTAEEGGEMGLSTPGL